MVNLLKLGSDVLESVFESHTSELVEFRKVDTGEKCIVKATIGGSSADASENQNFRTSFDGQDFIIRMATVVTVTPSPVTAPTFADWLDREPVQNDRVKWNGSEYIVSPIYGNEAWRYTDGFETSVRLHCKKVKKRT